MKIRIKEHRLKQNIFYKCIIMIFVYFGSLNPNPGFILSLRPLIFEKMVENREKSLKNRENSYSSGRVRSKTFFYEFIIHGFCVFRLAKFKYRVYFSLTPFNLCKNGGKP